MDALNNDLRLVDVMSAGDAINNARTVLEVTIEARLEDLLDGDDAEVWEGIRRHALPVLDAEKERLDAEYQRLRNA